MNDKGTPRVLTEGAYSCVGRVLRKFTLAHNRGKSLNHHTPSFEYKLMQQLSLTQYDDEIIHVGL
jgi:hypothetical protein